MYSKKRIAEIVGGFAMIGLLGAMVFYAMVKEDELIEQPAPTPAPTPIVLDLPKPEAPPVHIEFVKAEVEIEPAKTEPAAPVETKEIADTVKMIAQTVWGEARACSKTEQAAVVWSICNRFDSDNPYFSNCRILADVVTQPYQYHGYNPSFPVEDDIVDLVLDVLNRWEREKNGEEDVGRVLPKEYIFFVGDGKHNHFTKEYQSRDYWDWSLPSPYEEEV